METDVLAEKFRTVEGDTRRHFLPTLIVELDKPLKVGWKRSLNGSVTFSARARSSNAVRRATPKGRHFGSLFVV